MPAQSIQESLQTEFSPPLDTSLIAAIVADYVTDPTSSLSQERMKDLRRTLSELASQAEQDENPIGDDFTQLQLENTDETTSITDLFSAESSVNTANTSTASSPCQQLFSSPLGFLQAAFPHLPTSRLKSILGSAQEEDEIDMESIVADLLSSELVRELEERGLEDEVAQEPEWETVQPSKKKKQKKGMTIAFGDVRQRRHVQAPASPRVAAPDPWVQLSSVAAHLETLIPSRTAAYFQSLFHSPDYTSPSQALRSSLASMLASSSSSDLKSEETQILFIMFDVIRESTQYASLTDVERERMLDDAQLALRATQGNADAAIDIVWLLYDLDAGDVDWAVYHSPVMASSPFSPNGAAITSKHSVRLPTGPPTVQPPRVKQRSHTTSATPSPPPNAWKTIPVTPKRVPNPHAEFIPAYNTNKTSASKTIGKKQGNAHKGRALELLEQRSQALREASRAWQRGSTHNRGGEVALYFAERARELQEMARKENLDAAWDMVQSRKISTSNGVTIDLHGATVAEAIQVVKDVLRDDSPSAARPLKIITGRGKHSTNGIGVLGPAVNNILLEEGWSVAKWDGGLIVRGRNSRRV